MDDPARLTLPVRFRARLSGLPTELADELEDHLLESYRAARDRGCSPDDAERLAWVALGEIEPVCDQWLEASGRTRWKRQAHRFLGQCRPTLWMLLGVYLLSRICMALEPDRVSITGSILLGLAFIVLGMALRRSRWWAAPAEWSGALVLTGLGLCSLAAPSVSGWLEHSVALDPASAGLLALLAAVACLVPHVSSDPSSA